MNCQEKIRIKEFINVRTAQVNLTENAWYEVPRNLSKKNGIPNKLLGGKWELNFITSVACLGRWDGKGWVHKFLQPGHIDFKFHPLTFREFFHACQRMSVTFCRTLMQFQQCLTRHKRSLSGHCSGWFRVEHVHPTQWIFTPNRFWGSVSRRKTSDTLLKGQLGSTWF